MEVSRIIFSIFALICTANAYKILLMCPMPGRSHGILAEGLARHLAKAGHEITFIAVYAPKKPIQGVTYVDVSNNIPVYEIVAEKFLDLNSMINDETTIADVVTVMEVMVSIGKVTLENPNVQAILKDKNRNFDLIIAEWMYTEVYAGLSTLYKCPFVWFSTMEPHWRVLKLIDEIPHPAYNTDPTINSFPPFTFTQRVKELGMLFTGILIEKFFMHGPQIQNYKNLIVPLIEERGMVAPPFEDLMYNASLILGNSHVSLGLPMRLPDGYKAIGGYHIDENLKPLPKDLQTLMDNAKDGVIYFSMGSTLKSKSLPGELKQALLKVFGELKQTIIWKFEEDLPSRPKNVHIVQWAPQPSILAHKNCILFITHGGLLSTTETVHYGVPIIGIPVFADQFQNVDRSVKKGFAKGVTLSNNLATDLREAIKDILSDPKYKKKVEELSLIYHDRPVTPGKELVHWVEHVIKTGGATHLRSPALLVSWYQKLYLDLGLLLLALVLVVKYIIKYLISLRSKTDHAKKRN